MSRRATRLAALERGLPSDLDSWRLEAMRFIRRRLANEVALLPSPPPTDQRWPAFALGTRLCRAGWLAGGGSLKSSGRLRVLERWLGQQQEALPRFVLF